MYTVVMKQRIDDLKDCIRKFKDQSISAMDYLADYNNQNFKNVMKFEVDRLYEDSMKELNAMQEYIRGEFE